MSSKQNHTPSAGETRRSCITKAASAAAAAAATLNVFKMPISR